MTVSHLRFGPEPIRSTYLVDEADFVACHQFGLLEKVKVLDREAESDVPAEQPLPGIRGVGPPGTGGPAGDDHGLALLLGHRR